MTTFLSLYVKDDKPPVKNGLRDRGGSHRTAFWAGYDGLNAGLWPPQKSSLAAYAYQSGIAYKILVVKGLRPALPTS